MKTGRLGIASLVIGLAACAAPPAPQLQVKSGQSTRCISLQQIAGRRVLSDGSLLFEGIGPLDFRNRPASQCPGAARISRSAVISLVDPSPASQLCKGDRVRITDPVETGTRGTIGEPTCVLADFELLARP